MLCVVLFLAAVKMAAVGVGGAAPGLGQPLGHDDVCAGKGACLGAEVDVVLQVGRHHVPHLAA